MGFFFRHGVRLWQNSCLCRADISKEKECIQLAKYIVKRIFLAIVTILIVCAITFFAMNAIPGGPFDGEKAL